ncbi:fibrillarin-like rRNA/tRNA 2'-O-methyltransferase [archaeon]|nr:fibrillarin-like rRNA/tRNA 2'-O-methyltransferase [archaeon]
MRRIADNVFFDGKNLYTKNMVPGNRVHGEKLLLSKWGELREWDPHRSKLAAALINGLKKFPFDKHSKVLYLGAAQGTTASHLSDIAEKGFVLCIDISQKAMEELVPLCERRKNMAPILANANRPGEYSRYAYETNSIYQDVAQPNQSKILLKNSSLLEPGDYSVLCIKSRSIDSARNPETIITEQLESVSDGFYVRQVVRLEPYHKDHALVLCEKKLS